MRFSRWWLPCLMSLLSLSCVKATQDRRSDRLDPADGTIQAGSSEAQGVGGGISEGKKRNRKDKGGDDGGDPYQEPGGGNPDQTPGQGPGQTPGQQSGAGNGGYSDDDGYGHSFPIKPRERAPKVYTDAQGNPVTNLDQFFPLESEGWIFRSIDGRGNNLRHPEWGAAEEPLRRVTPVAYGDGKNSPSGADRPLAREISNAVNRQKTFLPSSRRYSDFLWTWGQFLDHDIDLTEAAEPRELFNIPIPAGDMYFDPNSEGDKEIELSRSVFENEAKGKVRQQLNQITAFVDASNVYGSDANRALELRANDGTGKLKVAPGNRLPLNSNGFPNAPTAMDPTFGLAGDVRANETVGLLAMHTLFVREHNRLAEELRQEHPNASGDFIYQKARAIVGGLMQVITYNEFLPVLLGANALPAYSGYQDNVNPSVMNVFSTAAYRVGHTMLSTTFRRLDGSLNEISEGHLELRDGFFNPSALSAGLAPLMRGFANTVAQEIDVSVVDDVRNFLFGPPGAGGFDLASLNIQRGRDHGLPDYNSVRAAFGLQKWASLDDVSSDAEMVGKLKAVYSSPDEVDPWVGGLAEDKVSGAQVGELFFKILTEQFIRLRDGDRYWYARALPTPWKNWVDTQTLSKVIIRNTAVAEGEIPANAFLAP